MSILNREIVSMTAIKFPHNPAFGAEFINDDVTYIWDGYAWLPRKLIVSPTDSWNSKTISSAMPEVNRISSFNDSLTSIIRSDLAKPLPKKDIYNNKLSPSKNFTTIQYQLFLKYAGVYELWNDIVLEDTFSRITKEDDFYIHDRVV